ncbi:MAG: hypothetical protein KC618_03790 [Candidatus Omnitrophica bacterium]|nr:hypothetical protein [Candidatus Omnitrophota bacterium]
MRLTPLILISVVLFLSGCVTSKPYVSTSSSQPRAKITITKNKNFADLDVDIMEPNENCKMQYMGTVALEKEHMSEVIYVPAGRQYFRVYGYFHLPLAGASTGFQERSFVAEPGGEYQIFLEYRGSGGYRKVGYQLHIMDISHDEAKYAETATSFSVCKQ